MRTLMNSCKNNIVMIVTVLSVLICSCFVIHFESDSELFHNEPAAKENYCSSMKCVKFRRWKHLLFPHLKMHSFGSCLIRTESEGTLETI